MQIVCYSFSFMILSAIRTPSSANHSIQPLAGSRLVTAINGEID